MPPPPLKPGLQLQSNHTHPGGRPGCGCREARIADHQIRRSPASRRFLFHSSIQESSQVALERLFSRRLSVRSEPAFEVPDPHLVLDLRLLDRDRYRRVLIDRVDPIVLTNNMQSPSYGLREAARCDFDGMFCAGSVETRYFASSKIHPVILPFRFSFAITLLNAFV